MKSREWWVVGSESQLLGIPTTQNSPLDTLRPHQN